MLDDSEKARLLPVVTSLQRAEADLASGRRELASVSAVLDRLAHDGTWRDRVLGGLASRDSAAAARYRDARRAHRRLTAAVAELGGQVERLAAAADDILEPVLRSRDVHYQRLLMAGRRCDRALAGCTAIGEGARSAAQEAQTVLKVLGAHPSSDATRRYNVEHAAQRYDDRARETSGRISGLHHLVDEARIGVTAATGTALTMPPPFDTSLLGALPAATAPVPDRSRLGDAIRLLALVTEHAATSAGTVRTWRKITDEARHAMLREARKL